MSIAGHSAPASTGPPPAAGASAGRTVAVAGATGLVGREILRGLLADETVAAVHYSRVKGELEEALSALGCPARGERLPLVAGATSFLIRGRKRR